MSAAAAKARAFLGAFKVSGCITLAAAAVPMDKTLHYRWLKNRNYAADFARAEIEFSDVLEACAIGRAKDGVLEAVFYQGAPCGAIRKYSDGLMLALLKRYKPAQYSTRVSAELSGPGGGPIAVTNPRLAALSDDELRDLIAITEKLDSVGGAAGGPEAAGEAED
jgi:hypothetical protein